MFCAKCGKQLNDDAKFCIHCGEPCGKNPARTEDQDTARIDVPDKPYQQAGAETSTGKAFMEQLSVLAKTGAKGIKEAAAQAQTMAGELSATIDKSQELQQLGGKKNLFFFVCGALIINLLLLIFSKTIYFELLYYRIGAYSVIGFCSAMLEFIKLFASYMDGATDGPFYAVVRVLEIAGILFILAAAVKTAFPLFTNKESMDPGKPMSFKLIKIAVIYSVALTVLFMLFITATYSSQNGIECRLTFMGWVYILESVALIAALFMLSPKAKKNI
jgi:hypothetical protein